MKHTKLRRTGLSALLLLTLLTGCGSSSYTTSAAVSNSSADYDGSGWEETWEKDAPMDAYGTDITASNTVSDAVPSNAERKLIYTADLSLETTAFDQTVADLTDLTAQCGGYFQSSSVDTWRSGYRHGSYVVRVHAEQYRTFLEQAGKLCHQLRYSENTDDVSTVYYDLAGRLKTQQTKLERLQELLSQAKDMADIITLKSAISETEETIERLSGTLRDYDAQVDESTVTIDLDEVYTLSNVEEPATGFLSRIGTALSSGWKGFLNTMEALLIALAYSWMWVLLIAVVVILLVRKHKPHFPHWKPHKSDNKSDTDKSE